MPPTELRVPIDVLLEWRAAHGLPADWDRTVATWPEPAPPLPSSELHHLCAVHDGCTVGVHVVTSRRTGQLNSVWCAVHPAFRGRGIAQRLLARHARWAEEHAGGRLRAHVPAREPGMLIVALKAGFTLAGTFTDADGVVLAILEARG